MRYLKILILFVAVLMGCSKGPDIQGVWYFDYEKTRPSAFPNAQYESARLMIADTEPRYGAIHVDGDSVVLGGAVCKVQRVNDENGLKCDERGLVSQLSLFLEDGRLVVKTHGAAQVTMVFSRTKQDPFAVYGIDPNAKALIEESAPREQVAEPTPDLVLGKFIGYARTTSFSAFYDPESIKAEGRYVSVKVILNYAEPQGEGEGMRKALSSVQVLTFDCPGANYRLDRYVQYSEPNGVGVVVSDSAVFTDYRPEMKPVPENSVNKMLYGRVCR